MIPLNEPSHRQFATIAANRVANPGSSTIARQTTRTVPCSTSPASHRRTVRSPAPVRASPRTSTAKRRAERPDVSIAWGLLLDGPPGNGKSSLSLALAGELRSPLYVLSLGDPNITDDRLTNLLADVPRGSVVVAEDVDAIFTGRERAAENKLTFSGLLNAIDGPVASEGRVLVLTTNRPADLDPALIRPGRVDRRLTLGDATDDQARQMWRRFGRPECGEDAFARWAIDGARSMATLQQRLLQERTT